MGTLFLRVLLLGAVLPAAATEDTDMVGAGRWEIAVPAFVIGVWMADLALREMGVRRWRW